MLSQSAARPKSQLDNLNEKVGADTGPYCIITQFVAEEQMSTMATLGNSVALVISASPEHYIPLPYA
jgi:hypothetical protein